VWPVWDADANELLGRVDGEEHQPVQSGREGLHK
jgi:hypothetical protein